jgi:hypothetical protein
VSILNSSILITALLDASKEVGLEVNPKKTKYMLVTRCQKAGQRQSIKIGNRSFDKVQISGNNTYRSKLYS